MPRLTDTEYLLNYHRLRDTWIKFRQIYSYLSPVEQWNLHAYYQPSNNLTDAQLLAHRRTISKRRPSLPHQAGKIIAKLDELALSGREQRDSSGTSPSNQRVFVRGVVVQPELALKKLARVFIMMAENMARKEQEAA